MAYTLQSGAPTLTTNGRTFGILAQTNSLPIGTYFQVMLVENVSGQGWTCISPIFCNVDLNDLLATVKGSGDGMKGFMAWLLPIINKFLATVKVGGTTPTGEPTTNEEAAAAIVAAINGLKLQVENGGLVLK